MQYLYKYILFFLFACGYFNCQLQAGGTIKKFLKSFFMSKEKRQQLLLNRWFEAARIGNIHIIQNLIGKIDINVQDSLGYTALIYACGNNHENIVKLLLQVPKIDVNVQGTYGTTALMHTLFHDNYNSNTENIVKLLLQVPGININLQNGAGSTTLMFACSQVRITIVRFLLQVPDVKINIQDEGCRTALSDARKHPLVVDLIENKINQLINQAFEAIKLNNLECLKTIITQLMPQPIDTIFDEKGNTLLDKAFTTNNFEIVIFLLQNSQDPRESLARLSFEVINPTSPLFKFFVNLAFGLKGNTKAISARDGKSFKANKCQTCLKETDARCSKCKKVYYCSAKCQKTDWLKHKPICRLN